MNDKVLIDNLIQKFFNLFTNKTGVKLNLKNIYNICINEALIVKNVGGETETYNLENFISPREVILSNGTLTEFSEYEIEERTNIFGHIAQRICIYEKSGIQSGKPFLARGMKTFQFIKKEGEWKIIAMAWDDESDNLNARLN